MLNKNQPTFSARIRSPTSRVGYIEAEGMDLGSAKKDLKSKLTVIAVNAAFVSSEQTFNILVIQLVLSNSLEFALTATVAVAVAAEAEAASTTEGVPPLSTSQVGSGTDSLQGSHFEPCKKGIIEEVLMGEIPKTPPMVAAEDAAETPAVDFITVIKPRTIGLLKLSPRISPARVE